MPMIICRVSDGVYSDTVTVTFVITDVNDKSPVFDRSQYTGTVFEGVAIGYFYLFKDDCEASYLKLQLKLSTAYSR